MNEFSCHRQWLYTSFPVDSNREQPHNNLRGRRVWSKQPLVDWHDTRGCRVLVEPEVGGTVALHGADDVFVVRWDNGCTAMHRKDDLLRAAVLIGGHESLRSYLDGMRQHACRP